jgi:hypothetical protein
MAKANSGKVIQMLSPENYIRKKARTLPVYECLVNADWEKSKMASIVVARQHINGNITACIYLVDLMLLGVKDTDYMFNVPLFEYKENIDVTLDRMDLISISYELAHNIVHAGLEFADEYGFSPHKDFTSITCYMLEEDNDNIELIDIECGHRGKPAYMRTPFDSKTEVEKIITRLTKTAGPGNFIIIDNANAEDLEDFYDFGYEDKDDFEDEYDEFYGKTLEEKHEIFMQLFNRLESLTHDEIKSFSNVSDSLFYDICDPVLIDEYYDKYMGELDIDVMPEDEIPDELPGIVPGIVANPVRIKELFIEVYNSLEENPENARKKWKTLRSQAKTIPGVAFLELIILSFEESAEYEEKLNGYFSQHNDYPMIRLLWLIEQVTSENLTDENLLQVISRETFFPGRHSLHRIELYYFLMYFIDTIAIKDDPSKLEAFSQVLDDFEGLPDNDRVVLLHIISLLKVKIVINHFENNIR